MAVVYLVALTFLLFQVGSPVLLVCAIWISFSCVCAYLYVQSQIMEVFLLETYSLCSVLSFVALQLYSSINTHLKYTSHWWWSFYKSSCVLNKLQFCIFPLVPAISFPPSSPSLNCLWLYCHKLQLVVFDFNFSPSHFLEAWWCSAIYEVSPSWSWPW